MSDKFKITLKVAVSELIMYTPRNEPEEEEIVREAVKLINKKVVQYKRAADDPAITDHDFLAMATVQIARAYVKISRERDTSELEAAILKLDQEIADFIKETSV